MTGTPDKRWFKARMDEAGVTQADLSRALDLDRSNMTRILSGARGVSLAQAQTLAKKLSVPTRDVYLKLGYDWPGDAQEMVQVDGLVTRFGTIRPRTKIEHVAALPGATHCLRFITNLAGPLGPLAGYTLHFRQSETVGLDALNRVCHITFDDGGDETELVGVLRQGSGLSSVYVETLTSGDPLERTPATASPLLGMLI